MVRAEARKELAVILTDVDRMAEVIRRKGATVADPLERHTALMLAVIDQWPTADVLAHVVAAMIINSVDSDISDLSDLP